MTTASTNLHACHRCPRRCIAACGVTACSVDGRNIVEHAERGDCPEGRFPKPAAAPCVSRGLGDTIAKVAKATGIAAVVKAVAGARDCGCDARQKKLNQLFPYKS